MLYLEDYLEMIEHLPQELRDRFTEMREMDLSVQNSMDSLEKRVKVFFANAKKMRSTERDGEYLQLRRDYYKTLEDADEKVHLANSMYDLVDRYLRRLDQELHKFKMELEADNAGITEILEKRSLELDQPQSNSSQKENRYSFTSARVSHNEKHRDSSNSGHSRRGLYIPQKRIPGFSTSSSAGSGSGSSSMAVASPSPNSSNVSYNLGHIGAGGNAIAAAASQAIAATQQMQQGRRTASLKASYEAINIGVQGHEFIIGKELAGAAQTAIAAIQETTKKQKKKSSSSSSAAAAAAAAASTSLSVPSPMMSMSTSVASSPLAPPEIEDHSTDADASVDPNADNPDWTYDPNEPRYCICNQVSYGDMVACDNEDCPFEWFHYACVDIKAPPKGKWYCPQCASSMKRRGSRKN